MARAPALPVGAHLREPKRLTFSTEDPVAVVIDWHSRNHPDPWQFCTHELCDRIRGRDYRRP